MNITSAKYLKEEGFDDPNMILAVIEDITMCVPIDTENMHYAEILRQVDAGELTIEAADE